MYRSVRRPTPSTSGITRELGDGRRARIRSIRSSMSSMVWTSARLDSSADIVYGCIMPDRLSAASAASNELLRRGRSSVLTTPSAVSERREIPDPQSFGCSIFSHITFHLLHSCAANALTRSRARPRLRPREPSCNPRVEQLHLRDSSLIPAPAATGATPLHDPELSRANGRPAPCGPCREAAENNPGVRRTCLR